MDEELRQAQELCKRLSVYKNQEYPEKLLQINNLRRKLEDLNSLHEEEKNNLLHMIKSERNIMDQQHMETTEHITDKVSIKAMAEMHSSLKDKASDNTAMKSVRFLIFECINRTLKIWL